MRFNSAWCFGFIQAVNNEKPLAVVCNGEELGPVFGLGKVSVLAIEDRMPPPPRAALSLAAYIESGNPVWLPWLDI